MNQRSSIFSSLLTALVGWLGFMFIGPLLFGFKMPSGTLISVGILSAILQIIVLRSGFFLLQMHRSIFIGAAWGTISAIAMYFITAHLLPIFNEHQFAWLLNYFYIGAPVGGFLSYFYIDDKKITDAACADDEINYGRDAHWFEPFAFGALGYLLAYLPFSSLDYSLNVLIVGAITGVLAAGLSHFSPDKWKKSFLLLILLIIVLGTIVGLITVWILRVYSADVYFNKYLHGIIAGIITFALTFLRGRYLAQKEEKGMY